MLKTQQHEMIELVIRSETTYRNPFTDVWVDCVFTDPDGEHYTMPAFYDSDGMWKVRFSPAEAGTWHYQVNTRPVDVDMVVSGMMNVLPNDAPGMLRTTNQAFGFAYSNDQAMFPLGDTVYNLFGAAFCDMDVKAFLKRRAEQGFNLFRVRCQVSKYHPPECYNEWQTRSTWPWRGSEQSPRFDQFNLDYFKVVDDVVAYAAELGIGLEMIMEAWGFEFPFNNRAVFVPEYEKLWLRYLIARYDAYSSVYIWTLMNEYSYYPDGKMREKWIANQWAINTARWVKATAPHGHVVAVHNGPKTTPFAKRFATDPTAVDAVMFQDWGTIDEENGWLTTGIEDIFAHAFEGWQGSAIFAEWGYERNRALPLTFPGFTYCGADHNRHGAWRAAFLGYGAMNGWENTWGPVMDLEHDQPGIAQFSLLKQFMTQVVPFERLVPNNTLIVDVKQFERGHCPRVLATEACDIVAVYSPAGEGFTLDLDGMLTFTAQWFNPISGDVQKVQYKASEKGLRFDTPGGVTPEGHPQDWTLVVSAITL